MPTPVNGYVPAKFLSPLVGSKPGVLAERNTAAAYARLRADHPEARVSGLAAGYWSRAVDNDLRRDPGKYSIVDKGLSPVGKSPHGLGTRINFHGISRAIAARYGFSAFNSYTFDYVGTKSWNQVAPAKSLVAIAREVIAGKWGVGAARKRRLAAAGHDPKKVQTAVNAELTPKGKSVDTVAREVIAGKWGNGDERRRKLTNAGWDYTRVQARVNQLT